MVKIKRMNKMLAVLFLSASMIFATGTTAFAYVDESAEASKTETNTSLKELLLANDIVQVDNFKREGDLPM